ncbi:MAG: sugar ABC transporter permease [Oscillospiraceae bacterium]|nr:sugar ABC transporter permease [Oscillospiraceae bacterium]
MKTASVKSEKSVSRNLWNTYKYPLFFLTPWILGLLVFQIYPILSSLYLSFTNFSLFGSPDWVGLDNYARLMNDGRFLKAIRVTNLFVFVGVPLQLSFALTLALLLNKGVPGLKFFRAAYYLPALLGGSVAISILWRQIFGLNGLVNRMLESIGVPDAITGISWVSNPSYAIHTLILLRVWQFGSPMIIFLAGLKQVPMELYESAAIDGAGAGRRFLNITLPMLSPIILFNLIMQIISAFQSFTPALIVAGNSGLGGSLDSLLLYTIYLYQIGFQFFRMGIASAMAWIMLIALGILTIIIIKVSKSVVYYED